MDDSQRVNRKSKIDNRKSTIKGERVNQRVRLVRVERGEDGRLRVLSPGVGWWLDHPHPGALVGPGSRVGAFARLNRRDVLVLPPQAAGRVMGPLPRDRAVPVEYGQPLFQLAPVEAVERDALQADPGGPGHPADAGNPPGTWAVVSPTDGIFYQRPSPGARAFVEPGSRVRAGQPLGLVEVMKTFNPIPYGGPGLPEVAEVVEIRCGDAEEVRAGQVLMLVRGGGATEAREP